LGVLGAPFYWADGWILGLLAACLRLGVKFGWLRWFLFVFGVPIPRHTNGHTPFRPRTEEKGQLRPGPIYAEETAVYK
jgi:hypothetical protein